MEIPPAFKLKINPIAVKYGRPQEDIDRLAEQISQYDKYEGTQIEDNNSRRPKAG